MVDDSDSDASKESADVLGGSEGIFDDVRNDHDTITMPPPASPSKSGPHVMIPVVLVVL